MTSLPSPAAAILAVKHAVSASSPVGYSVSVDGGIDSIALVEAGGVFLRNVITLDDSLLRPGELMSSSSPGGSTGSVER